MHVPTQTDRHVIFVKGPERARLNKGEGQEDKGKAHDGKEGDGSKDAGRCELVR